MQSHTDIKRLVLIFCQPCFAISYHKNKINKYTVEEITRICKNEIGSRERVKVKRYLFSTKNRANKEEEKYQSIEYLIDQRSHLSSSFSNE